jgi:hypothetical protein
MQHQIYFYNIHMQRISETHETYGYNMCSSTYCRANEGLLTLAQEGAMRGMGGAQREARGADDVRREA